MRKIYYRDAVREALDEEMARDPMVMMIGEDVGPNGGTWKANAGLWEKYGDLRMKDSPISESGFVGMCVGMALTGMRPIAEVMFSDFMLVAMDQIVNQMAKITYMSGGQRPVPMVLRTTIGLGRASAAQHSQSLNSIISYFPGLKVVVPSDAYTAKGLLKSAIRDNSPVVVVEHRMQYSQQFDMPDDADENLLIPIGKAAVVRPLAGISGCRRGAGGYRPDHRCDLQHGGQEPDRCQAHGKRGRQHRGHRPPHHQAPGQGDHHQVRQENRKAAGGGRGLHQLRHFRRDRLFHHAGGVL